MTYRRMIPFVLALLLLVTAGCGGGKSDGREQTDTGAAEQAYATPEPTPEPDPDPELAALYGGYRDAIEQMMLDMEARGREEGSDIYDRGAVRDVDGDGWPELMVIYSPDGKELHAMLGSRTALGTARYLDVLAGLLDEGLRGDIFSGELYDIPMLFVTGTSETEDGLAGSVIITAIKDIGIQTMYTLRWNESLDGSNGMYYVDGIENKASFDELFDGMKSLECSAPSDRDLTLPELIDELDALSAVYGR